MLQEIAIAGAGLVLTTFVGFITYLGKRILNNTDELRTSVQEHAVTLAEVNLKMPNGEWREMKDGISACQGGIRHVGERMDSLTEAFNEHAQNEKARMCEAIAETFPRVRPTMTFAMAEPASPKPRKRSRRAAKK